MPTEVIKTVKANVDNQVVDVLLKFYTSEDWKLYINQQLEMTGEDFDTYNDAFIKSLEKLRLEDKRILQIGGGDWQIASKTYLKTLQKGYKVDVVDPLAVELLRLMQDCAFMQKNPYIKFALDSDFFKEGIPPAFIENTKRGILVSIYSMVFNHFYDSYKRPGFYDHILVDVSDPIKSDDPIQYVANSIYGKDFVNKLRKLIKKGGTVIAYLPGPIAEEMKQIYLDNGFEFVEEQALGEMFLQDKKNHQQSYVATFRKAN